VGEAEEASSSYEAGIPSQLVDGLMHVVDVLAEEVALRSVVLVAVVMAVRLESP